MGGIAAQGISGGMDTIVAIATASGRGAISMVRLSGRDAFPIARRIVKPWPRGPRRATLSKVSSFDSSEGIDQAVITIFTGPDSFTGEDMVEISCHGGLYIQAATVRALMECGARQALPGEFTRRAVLNGKIDITQAEAIGELIEAQSGAMHRAALDQLDGGLSRRISILRDRLIKMEALIAYDIDFPEEDDGPVPRERVNGEATVLLDSLEALLATVPAGAMIRTGAVVVIAGQPNVGKSSLFNAVLGQSRAIVTERPGTTRDAIEGFVEAGGWPVRLIDTAGLRETADVIERLGIEVSERYIGSASVILACGDSERSIAATMAALAGKTAAPVIRIRTKSDLEAIVSRETGRSFDIEVSSESGSGLVQLMSMIGATLANTVGPVVADMPILTSIRHIRGLQEARAEIQAFQRAWREESLPAPVAAVHLRSATGALESLVGAVSAEEVLDRVFSSFCVGK